MALLVGMAAVTAYAIAITALHMKQNEENQKLRVMASIEKRSAISWRTRASRIEFKLDQQRAEYNDEIHTLEKENRRLLDTNARMMERMKRLMP